MIIAEVTPLDECVPGIVTSDGRTGAVDVSRYLDSPAFAPLKEETEFIQIRNGKYFVEWACCADLSADTLEARMTWAADDDEKLMVAENSEEYKTK